MATRPQVTSADRSNSRPSTEQPKAVEESWRPQGCRTRDRSNNRPFTEHPAVETLRRPDNQCGPAEEQPAAEGGPVTSADP